MSAVRKMNPQWKNFQPPTQDPAILSYHRSPTANSVISTTNSNFIRETGYIEKLLHSYGFIQCCERDARLFFHFSEYNGDMNTVKIGDAVEFEISSDKRTGRPIASSVVKMDTDHVSVEALSDERFKGTVVQEAKPSKFKNGFQASNQDGLGRVTYEHSGECFFLPYDIDDIIGNGKFQPGDQVTFYIATDKRNGNIQARKLESVHGFKENKNQGVVCSMKEKFGFIERADIVKEIFFHFSEFKGNINEMIPGDDVEFDIQTRNGKEVAVNVSKLPEGTVIFEDVALERLKGTIMKTLKNHKRQGDPLGGRITYETSKGATEIPFGDKDQRGDCTLQSGDIVEFNIATDRRDKLKRATNILLLENSFEKTGERREPGTVVSLKEGYGFIQCAEREARMFFHFSERIDASREFALQDEVEFTVTQDPSCPSRQIAIRIQWLNKGTIPVMVVHTEKYIGTVDREPALYKSPVKNKDGDGGTIVFDFKGAIQLISYQFRDLLDIKSPPRYGDKVEFCIGEMRNNSKQAINVKVVIRNIAGRCRGFVATLKDNYGFIENADHEKEVFFHFSSFDGDPSDLDIGDELEYTITRKSAKLSAETIHKLPKGTIPPEEILKERGQLQGKVLRPMRIVNPDQEEYCGLVQADSTDDHELQQYPYGVTSLADKRDFLQKGDIVKFNLAVMQRSNSIRAVNIAAVRKYIRAKVSSVKGQFGFLNYEVEDGKKLFFHMTEVHDGVEVQPGNEVEFVVIQNQLNKKFSACSLRKITDTQRPERLVSRLKSINDEIGVRVLVIRQPKGPDGTKGFSQPRAPWN